MGKLKYKCDYCNKRFSNIKNFSKIHKSSISHLKNKNLYFSKFSFKNLKIFNFQKIDDIEISLNETLQREFLPKFLDQHFQNLPISMHYFHPNIISQNPEEIKKIEKLYNLFSKKTF